jgi:NAD(P)-dependent dehydrogenase (short-subunit alcohol dehydrogenase family)
MKSEQRPVAVVTGARQGIGKGIALALAASGFDLVLVDLQEDSVAARTLQELAAAGANCRFLVGDISAVEKRGQLAEAIFSAFGQVDTLVNNAGVQVQVRGDLLEVTPESFDRVMGVNLRGTFFLTQEIARRMIEQGAHPAAAHRSIITISSANAYLVAADRPEYCFSKMSLSMMTKAFALRLGRHGIACYEIRPGVIRTDMTAGVKEKYDRLIGEGLLPIARWGEPADVGGVVATLARGGMPYSTGDAFHVDGGLHIHKI